MKRLKIEGVDLTPAVELFDFLTYALRTLKPLIVFKNELRRQCFRLHDLCRNFEDEGLTESHEDVYLPLFDALSFLTMGLRFPSVDLRLVSKCKDKLTEAMLIGGAS